MQVPFHFSSRTAGRLAAAAVLAVASAAIRAQQAPAVLDDANRFQVAKALGCWSADIPESYQERADQVMAALRAAPPPPGWRPLGPDDELLRTLLPGEEA